MIRFCRSCERRFEPSSRHLDCPACPSRNGCTCGNPKQSKSETYRSCWLARGQADSADHHWKGGRTTHEAGYLMVRLRGHPRAKTNGYVFEHVDVMESMLGRQMLPDESVHHRNGVRDDDRPGNLELWVRPQPSAIRKEDAVASAREILERYGDRVDHPQQGCDLLHRSPLGGGGIRTRVAGRPSGSSPGASGGEISPRASHRRRGPRPVRVRCPSEAPGRNLLGESCLRCPVRAAGPPGRTAT